MYIVVGIYLYIFTYSYQMRTNTQDTHRTTTIAVGYLRAWPCGHPSESIALVWSDSLEISHGKAMSKTQNPVREFVFAEISVMFLPPATMAMENHGKPWKTHGKSNDFSWINAFISLWLVHSPTCRHFPPGCIMSCALSFCSVRSSWYFFFMDLATCFDNFWISFDSFFKSSGIGPTLWPKNGDSNYQRVFKIQSAGLPACFLIHLVTALVAPIDCCFDIFLFSLSYPPLHIYTVV